MRLRTLAAVALAPAVLAGCTQTSSSSSSGNFKGAQQRVADAVNDLEKAGQQRKASDVCALMTAHARQDVAKGGRSCESEMKKALDDADGFSLDVKAVTVTGDTAKAVVTTPDRGKDVQRTLTLKRESGGWRFDDFG